MILMSNIKHPMICRYWDTLVMWKKGAKQTTTELKKNTMYNQQQYLGFTYFVLEKKTHPNPMV